VGAAVHNELKASGTSAQYGGNDHAICYTAWVRLERDALGRLGHERLAGLFLFVDGVMKLMKPAIVVETTVRLGYPESVILGLGIVLLACTVLYAIPRTAVLGAMLLTGYLGGAVATHVRVEGGPFPVLFPVSLFPNLRSALGRAVLA
jgi:hypothetical protein